jgi:hypothetical protein
MSRTSSSGVAIALAMIGVLSCSDRGSVAPDDIGTGVGGIDALITSVSVSLASSSIAVGDSTRATATLRDRSGSQVTGTVKWSSSNSAIATVSSSGLVRGVSAGTASIVASHGSRSGSASVTVTQPTTSTAPVASVSVALALNNLIVGGSTQAVATTRDASNNVLTGRAVAWSSGSAAIASVSGSGLVTALAAGTTNITASSEGQTGSAALTVSSPPPPGSISSNEPAGMTLLTERPFNALNEDGWTNTGSSSYKIVADATAPKSPSNVGQIKFPAGFSSGNAPAVLEKVWTGTQKTLYVSFWVKFSSNWIGNAAGVNKIFHFWIGGSNRLVLNARGVGTGELLTEVELQGIKAGGNYDAGTTALFTANLGPSGELVRNQWLHWEAVFVGNSSGSANGSVDWWVNGTKVGHYGGLQFVSGAGYWEEMEWSPTYGGLGGVVPADQYQWLDHVYISGKAN